MKKQYSKIVAGVIFTLSVFTSVAQNDEKPVLERHSVSTTQKNKETTVAAPELKKSSIDVTNNNKKNSNDFSEQLNAPQLKRTDYSSARKEQSKNSK